MFYVFDSYVGMLFSLLCVFDSYVEMFSGVLCVLNSAEPG